MKIASVSETKNQLSALLDRVKRGETVLITDRRRPVAQLSPIPSGAEALSDEVRLVALERAGIIHRAKERPLTLRELGKPVKMPKGVSALKALLEEREENR